MRSWTQRLSQIVGQRSQVSSRTDPRTESGQLGTLIPGANGKLHQLDFLRLQSYLFSLPRQFVGRNARDLLGREWRRQFFNLTDRLLTSTTGWLLGKLDVAD